MRAEWKTATTSWTAMRGFGQRLHRRSSMACRRAMLGGLLVVCAAAFAEPPASGAEAVGKTFRAGAAAVDVSPKQFPVWVSGSFLARQAERIQDPVFARALVLDDGQTKIVVAVVDTLMMTREWLDEVKRRAAASTGIPTERMLICATHTHSAPSVMGALGTPADERYAPVLAAGIVEAIEGAAKRLVPAKVGWAVVEAPEHTHCRRWIKRPDRIGEDPFGGRTVRAMMHPGYQNPDFIGPSGPKDPGLTVLAVQTSDGRPLALLANYSMHYFGAAPVSADYFGRFCAEMARRVGGEGKPAFVAMISQGTAGDLHWMDYSQPKKDIGIDAYAAQVAAIAWRAYQNVRYRDWVPLAAAQRKLTLARRVPDENRLAWARRIIETMKDRERPASIPEVYALEQFALHAEPQRELILQAMRIGDLGIAAIPAEVFAITGLKIKAQSPLEPTFNIELANGAEGYIPPPEQHALGGYTTWPARTAGLEVQAEPKIVEAVLQLLEQVAGKPRRPVLAPGGTYQAAVLQSRPAIYWPLDEFAGPQAVDASGNHRHGVYEDGVAFYLDGVASPGMAAPGRTNRAVHFAGGRLKAAVPNLGSAYSVEFWFWNGLPHDLRPVTAVLFSRSEEGKPASAGDCLALGGTAASPGRLIVFPGGMEQQGISGKSLIPIRTWNHVLYVRDGRRIAVHLNFHKEPEITCEALAPAPAAKHIVFGGRGTDEHARFEGKLDEVAIYDRAVSPEELARHGAAALQ